MLKELALQNFKPFASRQVVPLAPITVIYGPNSAGKSSIIQALMLLRQSLGKPIDNTRPLVPRGEFVDLGSFRSLAHQHQVSRLLKFSVKFESGTSTLGVAGPRVMWHPARRSGEGERLIEFTFKGTKAPGSKSIDSSDLVAVRYALLGEDGFDVRLNRSKEKIDSATLLPMVARKLLGGDTVGVFEWADQQSIVSLERWQRARLAEELAKLEGREAPRGRDDKGKTREAEVKRFFEREREMLSRSYSATNLEKARFLAVGALPTEGISTSGDLRDALRTGRSLLSSMIGVPFDWFGDECDAILRSFSYLGPLRSYPARYYMAMGGGHETVGRAGENAPQLIYRHRATIKNLLNHWFGRFDIPYKLEISLIGDEAIGELLAISLVDQRTSVAVSPSDVGFGLGQLLPILVEGVISSGRLICVEQPEIHLHPRLQAHVADLLIETASIRHTERSADGSARANQWLVETHSEALMLRLQRRIREGVISPEDVSVIYVEPSAQGSRIRSLGLDGSGEFIDEWPDGFFEEGWDEMMGR